MPFVNKIDSLIDERGREIERERKRERERENKNLF